MGAEEWQLSLVLGLNNSSWREGSWGVVVGPRRCAAASEDSELGWVNILLLARFRLLEKHSNTFCFWKWKQFKQIPNIYLYIQYKKN
jgi:hypothetical protein